MVLKPLKKTLFVKTVNYMDNLMVQFITEQVNTEKSHSKFLTRARTHLDQTVEVLQVRFINTETEVLFVNTFLSILEVTFNL